MKHWWVAALIIGALVSALVESAHAAGNHQDQIVKTIVGEAADQGNQSMRAHAHAIMNRGMMGAHGRKAVRYETVDTYRQARASWIWALDEPDFTGGATHWLSEEDIQQKRNDGTWLKWNREFRETLTIKDTTFYRKRRE